MSIIETLADYFFPIEDEDRLAPEHGLDYEVGDTVEFQFPSGFYFGRVKEICNEDLLGDVWVCVIYWQPAIKGFAQVWLRTGSIILIEKAAA